MKRTLILGIVFLFPACRMFAQAPAQIPKPFSRVELLALRLAGQHQDHMERDVANRGIDFQLTEEYVSGLRAAGARDALIEAVRKARAPARHPRGWKRSPTRAGCRSCARRP